MKEAKVIIDGEVISCRIVAIYTNGTARIEYPVYRNGLYAGYIAETVAQDEIVPN